MRVLLGFAALVLLLVVGRIHPSSRSQVRLLPPEAPLGFVDYVVDGDTVDVLGLGRVRVIGVNTPEVGQPGAAEATEFTRRACDRRWVRVGLCPVKEKDQYGRRRAEIHYQDETGRWRGLAEELILSNHGVAYSFQPCHLEDEYWYDVQSRADGQSARRTTSRSNARDPFGSEHDGL